MTLALRDLFLRNARDSIGTARRNQEFYADAKMRHVSFKIGEFITLSKKSLDFSH